MGRSAKLVQVNYGRKGKPTYRMLYRNDAVDFIQLGSDEEKANRIAPVIRSLITDNTTLKQSRDYARMFVAAGSIPEEQDLYYRLTHIEEVKAKFLKRSQQYNQKIAAKLAESKFAEPEEEACKERLSDCLDEWKDFSKIKKSKKHINRYEKLFNEFIKFVGDKPVNKLCKNDIVRYKTHVLKAQGKQHSGKWFNDRMIVMKAVLMFAKRNTEFPFPPDMRDWLDMTGVYAEYVPDPNKIKAITPDQFKRLLKEADKWANIDVDDYAKSLPTNNKDKTPINNLRQAGRMKRFGKLWAAQLRFAACFGADNEDICNVKIEDIKTNDDGMIYCELRRHKNGQLRKTPLLPSVVKAIEEWTKYEKPAKYIFPNEQKRKSDTSTISDGFTKLAELAELKNVLFKQHRKIGSTIGKKAGINLEVRDAWLGHKVKGVNMFYTEGVDETYLIELVNLIGKQYFGGEQV